MKLLNFQILLAKFTLGIYIKNFVEVIKEITYKLIFVFASLPELPPVICPPSLLAFNSSHLSPWICRNILQWVLKKLSLKFKSSIFFKHEGFDPVQTTSLKGFSVTLVSF